MPPRMGKIRNGGQRHGLWRWSAGDVVPDEAGDNPRVRDCPTCRAPATKPCRRRSRAGLVAMTGYLTWMVRGPSCTRQLVDVAGSLSPPAADYAGGFLTVRSPSTWTVVGCIAAMAALISAMSVAYCSRNVSNAVASMDALRLR
jgi:hypothetical protein